MEWSAQREVIGSVAGKDVLDVGCGNGEKAIELALSGARSAIQSRRFDVVLFLQSLSYATDQARTLRAAHDVLRPDGLLVVTRAHPIRFAVERAERDGIEKKAKFPHKQAWLARYFGIIIFRARPLT